MNSSASGEQNLVLVILSILSGNACMHLHRDQNLSNIMLTVCESETNLNCMAYVRNYLG